MLHYIEGDNIMTTISLTGVKEGMHVHDVNNQHVGKVRFVKMSDESLNTPGVSTATVSPAERNHDESIVEEVAEAIVPDDADDLPVEMRERLLRDGYVRVDTGILRADRFVTPDQIQSISDDAVLLNITKDTLMSPENPV
jgi:hypothetical protein